MADLPKAGNQATAAARISLKYFYGTMQLSGQALKLADSNTRAFISALDLETNGLKADLLVDLNRQVYGNGTGSFATLANVTSAGADVTSGMQFIGINQIVDLWKESDLAAGAALYSSAVIGNYTDAGDGTGTVTWATALVGGTPANVEVMTIAGNANNEWTGLDAIVSDSGTLYNINPSSIPVWKAFVDSPSGAAIALTESDIIKNVDKVRKAGGKTSVMLTSLGVRRSYFGLLKAQRQFVNTSQENKSFEGGFVGLAFTTDAGEIPLVADPSAPKGTLYGLSEKNLKVYRESDWSFMDEDGSMWTRVPGDTSGTWKDAYSATMFQYSELGTDRRNVHFKMSNRVED